jgi:hypothetical protein
MLIDLLARAGPEFPIGETCHNDTFDIAIGDFPTPRDIGNNS